MPGKIELLLGPMRSNKTAELLRRAEMRREYARQYVLVLKPSDDTKGGPGVVERENGGQKGSRAPVDAPVAGADRRAFYLSREALLTPVSSGAVRPARQMGKCW